MMHRHGHHRTLLNGGGGIVLIPRQDPIADLDVLGGEVAGGVEAVGDLSAGGG